MHKFPESVSHPAKSVIVKQQAGIITPGLTVVMPFASGFRAQQHNNIWHSNFLQHFGKRMLPALPWRKIFPTGCPIC